MSPLAKHIQDAGVVVLLAGLCRSAVLEDKGNGEIA
jgi:hypothetical protein